MIADNVDSAIREIQQAIKRKNDDEAAKRIRHTTERESIVKLYKQCGSPDTILRWLYDIDALPEKREAILKAIRDSQAQTESQDTQSPSPAPALPDQDTRGFV